MKKSNKIKFWGTRGSNPSANHNMSTFGGETTCVELRTHNNELIIFDMGTGIIQLGNSLIKEKNSPKTIHILVSHFHWDHIIGFASFKPVYMKDYKIIVYARQPEHGSLQEVFSESHTHLFLVQSNSKSKAVHGVTVVTSLVGTLED